MQPSKADIDALVSVLEREDLADAESMAKELFKVALECASRHSSYAVGVHQFESVSLYGPLWTYNNAQQYGGAWAAAGDSPFIYPVKPAVISPAATVRNESEWCPECNHLKVLHVDRKWRPYTATLSSPPIDAGCGHFEKKTRCTCKQTFGVFSNNGKGKK